MTWYTRTLGVAILVFAPLAWGLLMARVFTRRRRISAGTQEGQDA